jgi:signal transduction histidine kinase
VTADLERALRRTAWRIAGQTTVLLVICLAVVGALVFLVVVGGQSRAVERHLTAAVESAYEGHRNDPDNDGDEGRSAAGLQTAVLKDGELHLSTEVPPGLPIRSVLEEIAAQGGSDRRDVRIGSHRYALLTVEQGGLAIQAVYGLDEFYEERQRVLMALGAAGSIGVVLATLLAAWLARRAVRPMGDALALQRRFVADAGHELRTPLTLLSTRSQLLRRRLTADAMAERTDRRDLDGLLVKDADGIVDDAGALTAILDDLLIAADTRVSVPAEKVDVSGLVREAVTAAQATAQERGLTLQLVSPAAVNIQAGAPVALKRAVTALVDNALAHAASCVEVCVEVRGNQVAIRVSDDGPGIADEMMPRLFERFSSARTRGGSDQVRHYGLGLALVSEIARSHGGDVTASNVARPGRGAVLSLLLPISAL